MIPVAVGQERANPRMVKLPMLAGPGGLFPRIMRPLASSERRTAQCPTVDFMRALFLGDSHLAQLGRQHLAWLERELASQIENAAFGGAWSGDLRRQVGDRNLRSFDVVLLSIGTNDTHPSFGSSPHALRENLSDVLARVQRSVLLLSPGVKQAPVPDDTVKLNDMIRAYSDVAARTVTARGGALVSSRWVLNELGPRAWESDGLHLSVESYDLLLPSLANALSHARSPT